MSVFQKEAEIAIRTEMDPDTREQLGCLIKIIIIITSSCKFTDFWLSTTPCKCQPFHWIMKCLLKERNLV